MGNNVLRIIFIFIIYIKQETDLAIAVRKFVYQKDLSEHCKRRVIPSIFLGNQVMEANSHVMHFSQLEVPYSCFLSVRAESGYNIILVIQLLSEYSLVEACAENRDQLIVYELGETFGGYWGPQPDVMMKPQVRNYTQYYTLKTTPAINTERSRKYKDVTQKVLQQKFPEPTDKEPDYIRMEVPLVNVSGNVQLVGPLRHTYNAEEMFDFIYDVTPRNGVEYETSIMPLVQFSIRPQKSNGYYDEIPRYVLDYDVSGFTTDLRLTFSTVRRRITSKKRKWFNNRRYNFGKKNHSLYSFKDMTYNYQKFLTRWPSLSMNTTIKSTVIPTIKSKYSTASWKDIDDIMKYFNITSIRSTRVENASVQNVLHDISNTNHNFSVYLIPNISAYYNKNHYLKSKGNIKEIFSSKPFTKKDIGPIISSYNPYHVFVTSNRLFSTKNTKLTQKESSNISLDSIKINSERLSSTVSLVKENVSHDNQPIVATFEDQTNINNRLENHKIKKYNDTRTKVSEISYWNKKTKIQKPIYSYYVNIKNVTTTALIETGTMVDHESWDNIVQAAPVMATVLNKTESFFNHTKTNSTNLDGQEKVKKSKRKKRYIQSLSIENSRPRNLTTKRQLSAETEQAFRISDIQDVARLVELQDDEIEGHVALRYLRNYVGSALFNICDFSEPKSRQTFLFNASRIVIALNNFTLDRMMLVATPAQSLLNSMSRCPPGYLECQVVGTRVCIDSTNSCDGVPNCGSYDIYDEDRLLCGASKDLQFNIYLAALTFLAVLLTMLYIVHYWLKRCVPRVSEAFFIYTDDSENTLFLDTIMRSPTDVDDASCKLVFSGHYFNNDLYRDNEAGADGNTCAQIFRKFCGFLLFKRKTKGKQSEEVIEDNDSKPIKTSKMFSFTELELRKYTPMTSKNEAIQTGDSYEKIKNETKNEQRYRHRVKESGNKRKSFTDHEDYTKEMNLIKFAKETRSSSSQSVTFPVDKNDFKMNRRHAIIADEEKEIRSTVYDRRSNKTPLMSEMIPRTCEVHLERPKKRVDVKHLRFEDVPTMIPSKENEEDDIADKSIVRRNVVLRAGHMNKQDLDPITETGETGSASKDFMRFWGAKGKKGKTKEKHLSIR